MALRGVAEAAAHAQCRTGRTRESFQTYVFSTLPSSCRPTAVETSEGNASKSN